MIIDKEIIEESIYLYGELLQTVVCMEELAELTQQLSKNIRKSSNEEDLISEIADVYICLDMITAINNIDSNKIQCEIYRKQERQRKRMLESKSDLRINEDSGK